MTGKRTDPYWAAQDILSRRDHSEAQVRQKMRRKGFSLLDINRVIEQLYTNKLLDDRQFASRYVENLLERKAVGPRYVAAKLKQKGITSALISEAIEYGFEDLHREEELVARAAREWQRLHPQRKDDRVRLVRFLLSRGFSSGAAYRYVGRDSQ